MPTVLVVDDTPIVREPIAASLRMEGFETVCASDGLEALSAIKRRRPDLILLDLAMPQMDGIAFLRAARSDPSLAKLPIILLTAVADRQRVVEAARLGVRDYLLKSQFSLKQLMGRVHAYIGAQQAEIAGATAEVNAADAEPAGDPQPPPPDPKGTSHRPLPAGDIDDAPGASGHGADSLKSLKPLVTRSQMTELLDSCGELKALSPSVMQIIKLTSSETGSVESVVEAVKMDQGIALKVLKLANSVVYTRGEPVENVHKAVMRIGLAQIRQAVLNISVVDQFGCDTHNQHLDGLKFWEHSIATGLICSQVARTLGLSDVEIDSAFTMGLLHDVGKLVYSDMLGETYQQVMATARSLQLPLEQVESRLLLVNHADAMDRILHAWRFPKNLINPIAFHHLSMGNVRHMARSTVQEVSMLGVADRLAHALLLGDSGNNTIYPTEEFCRTLRLEPATIVEIEQHIPGQTQDIKLAMLSRGTTQGASSPMDVLLRKELPEPFVPLYVSASPGIDAYRIAVDRLRDPLSRGEDLGPNIAIVHITSGRDCAAVTGQLQAAEAQLYNKPLPTVVISPAGDMGLSESPAARRRIAKVPSPTPVSRLIAAIRSLCPGDSVRNEAA